MQLQYQITLGEFKEMAWLRHRSSVRWILGLCVGAVGLIASAVFYIASDHSFGFFLFTVSLFLILLQCVIPGLIFRRFYRNNIRIFGPRTVTFDETGVTSDHELGRNEAKWSSYEKFRETKNLFLLHHTADLIGILPKRVFADPTELERFRALVTSKIPR